MPGITNRGKYFMLERLFRGVALPTNYYAALVLATPAPTADVNLFADAEVDEIATGNGYTAGGQSLTKNTTDFDVLTEDDTNDRALIQLRDIVWTASGGNLPASGAGARYMILTDDNATQTLRNVITFWDLGADRTVSSGQTLTVQNAEMRFNDA